MFATINYPESNGTQYEQFRYPGGEVQVRLTEKQVVVLQSEHIHEVHVVARITDGEIMALAQLIDAVRDVSGKPVKLILPYLPYGRADRRFVKGDCHGLAVFSRMLAMTGRDEIVTLDAHSNWAKTYIAHLADVSPKPIIDTVLQTIPGTTNVLLPDKGAARYGLGSAATTCEKQRDPETGKLSGFKVPSKEAFLADNILIVDDICDGGGTFLGIADALKEAGVNKPLYLYVSHGIFSKGVADLLKRFEKIYTTDSFSTPAYDVTESRLVTIPCMGTILDRIVDRPALWENANGK